MPCRKTVLGWVFATFVAAVASATASSAVPIVWEFDGTITRLGPGHLRPGGIAIGTPFSGSVTFDSDWLVVDRDPFTAGAVYGGEGPPYGIEFLVGPASYSTYPDARPIWYTVADDRTHIMTGVVADFLVISDVPPLSASTRSFTLSLVDLTATVLSSEEIVVVPPDLSSLSSASLWVSGLPPMPNVPMSPGATASGTIDHLSARKVPGTAIPEPTAAVLFAVGALAIARRIRSGCPTDC